MYRPLPTDDPKQPFKYALTTLSEAGDETLIDYSVDAALTGKLGSLGQPVLRSKAKEMERQFAARLQAAFDRTGAEAAS